MKVLHTSDWHLGQHFAHKDRKKEHKAFLEWLLRELEANKIDLLIVAGDIFHTGTPPHYAQELYYNFLCRVKETGCGNIVITGGNHDSVSMLKAPKILLKHMNIHIVESISSEAEKDLIEIKNKEGETSAIVCAVPYLRDRDIRKSMPGESYSQKNKALIEGIKYHYKLMAEKALEKLAELNRKIPVIGTGHLFAAGSLKSEGEQEIYVGSLGQIGAETFPPAMDYVALGHLHRSQIVGGKEHIRYSGSPISLSFSEASHKKEVILADFSSNNLKISPIPIPEFQKLRVVKGTLEVIEKELTGLEAEEEQKIWIEIRIDRKSWHTGAENFLKELTEELPVELFAIKLLQEKENISFDPEEYIDNLENLKPMDVFKKRLELEDIPEEEEKKLCNSFLEIVGNLNKSEEDL